MAEPELTPEQTKEFLASVLHLPEEIIEDRNPKFLKELILAWAENLPYHNITQVLLTKHEGRLATREEIIKEQLAGRGGVCIYHAYFMYRVLGSLGFRVRLIPSAVIAAYDHAIVTVHDVEEKGDEYLVEVGGGFPTLEPVPIHNLRKSDKATLVYKQSGLEFKYVLRGDTLSRYHRYGDDPQRKTYIPAHNESDNQDGWKRFYDSELRDFDLSVAFSPETQITKCLIAKDDRYFFLNQLRAVRIMCGKTMAIKGNVFLTQDYANGRHQTPLADDQACLDTLEEYFPMLDVEQAKEALDYITLINKQ